MSKPALSANSPTAVWQPMSSCPRVGLVLLKTPAQGRHWPIVGEYSHIHGAFCSIPFMGQNEQQLFPVAWTEIPAFDAVRA